MAVFQDVKEQLVALLIALKRKRQNIHRKWLATSYAASLSHAALKSSRALSFAPKTGIILSKLGNRHMTHQPDNAFAVESNVFNYGIKSFREISIWRQFVSERWQPIRQREKEIA